MTTNIRKEDDPLPPEVKYPVIGVEINCINCDHSEIVPFKPGTAGYTDNPDGIVHPTLEEQQKIFDIRLCPKCVHVSNGNGNTGH